MLIFPDDAMAAGSYVLLHQPTVVNLADVLNEYGCPVHDPDRNIVEIDL
jgi:hypothetical protein